MLHEDTQGRLQLNEVAPGLVEVTVEGTLSTHVGAAFPRFAAEVARRRSRCAVFLDVRGLESFDGAVRNAWVSAVLEHRASLDEVVVLSSGLLVTISARAASVALAPLGICFDVVTDERRYLGRRLAALARCHSRAAAGHGAAQVSFAAENI